MRLNNAAASGGSVASHVTASCHEHAGAMTSLYAPAGFPISATACKHRRSVSSDIQHNTIFV